MEKDDHRLGNLKFVPKAKKMKSLELTEEASIGPSTQPEDDTSTNIVCDTPSPTDAETGADTDKTNSEDLEEKIVEIDEGQVGSNPGKTPESRPPLERVLIEEDQAGPNPRQSHMALTGPNPEPMHDDFIATVYPRVHESLKHTTEEHVHLENPLSSSETLSSMKNLEDNFTFSDQFINDKPTKEDPGKTTNFGNKVKSNGHCSYSSCISRPTTVHTSRRSLNTKTNIFSYTSTDLYSYNRNNNNNPFIATTSTTTKLFKSLSSLSGLGTGTRSSHWSFRICLIRSIKLSMKLSERSQPEHVALYEALEASLEHGKRDEFLVAKRFKSCTSDLDQIPETQEPDWVIPSNGLLEPENNWANAFATSYKDPEENKLL
ncbi:hypothetical protein Tco_1107379 [Tanacetum coccineum]